MRNADLPVKISNRVVQEIAEGRFGPGDKMVTQALANRLGVSRTPVRNALDLLVERGILDLLPNRGYFVAVDLPKGALAQADVADETVEYQRLAEDWIRDRIPEEMTELALRERYGWTKARTLDLLARALREGWAERKEGYGWRFLPVAKTPEAFDQIYRLRLALEPAALLEPTFRVDRVRLEELAIVQRRLLDTAPDSLPNETMLGHGAQFHEALCAMSGNPFFLMSLERVNRMRRLMEYRARVNSARLHAECTEHLEIIALLQDEHIGQAANRLRRHIEDARERKAPTARLWAEG